MLRARPRRFIVVVLVALLTLSPSAATAWNATGHKVISSIAHRQLDDGTKNRIGDVLRKHPAYDQLWKDRKTNGPDEVLNLFWSASIFPDDARGEPWRKYGRSAAHYVNYRIMADDGNRVEDPLPGENVINSYVAHLKVIRDPKTSEEDRALHLSWVFHQEQDIHQPLHAVARFSKALPQGDRGGNSVRITLPGGRMGNLHSYWDGAIGSGDDPAAIEKLADSLIAEYPASGFADDLKATNIGDWAKESVALSIKTVYRDLDPYITEFADRPVAYDADATKAARRRAALAGYRLANELKDCFRRSD
jgi:S1/P1 Nuclease